MSKLKKSVADLVAEARKSISEVGTEELISRYADSNVVVVDIRDIRERRRDGYIPLSFHAPRGMVEFWVDPECPYFKEIFSQEGKEYVFYCASGWRSALTVATLKTMGFEASHLQNGFTDWVRLGGPIDRMPD